MKKGQKKLLFDKAEKNIKNQNASEEPVVNAPLGEDDGQAEFFTSLPKKKRAGKESPIEEKNPDWNEDITLLPEEYEDLGDSQGMLEEEPEQPHTPDFDLGEASAKHTDEFQFSIDFSGEAQPQTVNEEVQERKYDPDNPRIIDWVFDIVEMFVLVLATVLILTSFFFKHSVVEGGSMNKTLADGDHLIISDLFYSPEYGDIVVFEDYSKSDGYKKPVIKRVIGLPGDTVEIKVNETENTLEVYVNGERLDEEYAFYTQNARPVSHGPVTVGEGQIYVLGDNRYNSTDSRDVGTINIDSILGKVILRIYPFNKFGGVE
jgi:signal peptidase I